MLKNKTIRNGFAVVMTLSMAGLAATSITAIRAVQPLTDWMETLFGNPGNMDTSAFTALATIPVNHWVVIGLFTLSATSSAITYIAYSHTLLQNSKTNNLITTGDA